MVQYVLDKGDYCLWKWTMEVGAKWEGNDVPKPSDTDRSRAMDLYLIAIPGCLRISMAGELAK